MRLTTVLSVWALSLSAASAAGTCPGGFVTKATWYDCCRRYTADGTQFSTLNPSIAASYLFDLGTPIRVTNLENGRSLDAIVHDRPALRLRTVVDLTLRGARLLGYEQQGHARICVQPLG